MQESIENIYLSLFKREKYHFNVKNEALNDAFHIFSVIINLLNFVQVLQFQVQFQLFYVEL